ncbi:helix-turn-helix domain-containing protein [Pseudoroseicyclus aestuarii]|uniref:XRE family transcriptional regulator n=1 Tax=Pseudoroseicyclus aestuarii TaxID=1795041 RepID=A0A318SP17_9RHOB|nr:XRE family transcriptional regulator [Pseudoroseicyclus aestuarii]PYE82436.1 XRE family transcriptional regulator [Pseudoroseicyclus aestuarii]
MTGATEPEQRTAHPAFGARLRERRRELNLTLREVAVGSGLSIGFISQAERDITVPSLTSLHNICRVLKIPVQEVLPEVSVAPQASRNAQRPLLTLRPDRNGRGYERISTTFPGSTLSSVLMHEPPGNRTEPQRHDGEEMFYMLDGSITVELEGEQIVLSPGDSLHFSSRRRHSTWNHTNRTALLLHVCTIDVFGDRIAEDSEGPGLHAGHEDARRAAPKDPA